MTTFREDWVKWGFGKDMHPVPDPAKPFIMDWRNACPGNVSYMDAALESAQYIHNTYGELSLMVSGGVDSQAMAYAFKNAGVAFAAYFARYPDGLNDNELDTFQFYEEHQIPIEMVDVDIISFHNVELKGWAKKYQNTSPHFLSHMKIASLLPGTIINSGCILLQYGIGHMGWNGFGMDRYSQTSGQKVIGYFLNYDPRMVWRSFNGNIQKNDMSTYEYKVAAYQALGFPVIPQPDKLHGFELFKTRCDTIPVDVRTRLRYKSKGSSRPYDLIYRYPLEDLVPHCSKQDILI